MNCTIELQRIRTMQFERIPIEGLPLRALRLAGLAVAIVCVPACAGSGVRRVVVPDADVELELGVEACVAATRELGAANAPAFLDGHLVRRGGRMVLVVREWETTAGGAISARRLTLAADPDLRATVSVKDPEIFCKVDRVTVQRRNAGNAAESLTIQTLTIARGTVTLDRQTRNFSISLNIEFTDPAETPIRFSGPIGTREWYQLTPLTGRASAAAGVLEYLRSDAAGSE